MTDATLNIGDIRQNLKGARIQTMSIRTAECRHELQGFVLSRSIMSADNLAHVFLQFLRLVALYKFSLHIKHMLTTRRKPAGLRPAQ
ncbi:hypothetical protein [Paraburkholderia terrae]|uniref:Uncharacterized protein n=1 Tax=Paraburkholderia terrae TaxID=311230 RepID=A0ABN6JU89_9BURK|nr:hypothetical protein [Paraburkholderia terrae]BCZ84385.1 hypothetical protein PTKU64_80600 [Paraburkholderia terrae]BDC45642.1 hypothetical protein PTKU15_89390 [Paraburkholderia terrae]